MPSPRLALGSVGLAVALVAGPLTYGLSVPAPAGTRPAHEAPGPALSPELPPEPSYGKDEDSDKELSAIARFSWEEFVALNWPAQDGKRGKPDPNAQFGPKSGRVVWGTWKSLDELFPHDDPEKCPPTAWDSFHAVLRARRIDKTGKQTLDRFDGLDDKNAGQKKILAQTVRLGTINQPHGLGPLAPLIARNGTYVRYEVRVNQSAYEFVTRNKYYLRSNLPAVNSKPPVPFDEGALVVKAAWMELAPGDDKEGFYHTPASLVEWTKDGRETLREATVGLVGFHIVRKTKGQPSWIWSTFEHVDNTSPSKRPLFSDPKRVGPAPENGFDYRPNIPPDQKPLPEQRPVDVARVNPVPDAIQKMNTEFHKRPGVNGTVWQNYQLVAVQWAARPDSGDPTDKKLRPVPPHGVVNTTLETYRQTSSCLACHTGSPDCAFVFFPSIRAFPPKHGP